MDSERKIGHEIRTLNTLLSRHFVKELKSVMDEDATVMHGWILKYVAKKEPEDVFQKDIEKKFGIAKSTATSTLKLMEKKGLITRESVEYDDRLKKICLTEKGVRVNSRIRDNVIKVEEHLKNGIEEERLEIFFDVLDKLTKNAQGQI